MASSLSHFEYKTLIWQTKLIFFQLRLCLNDLMTWFLSLSARKRLQSCSTSTTTASSGNCKNSFCKTVLSVKGAKSWNSLPHHLKCIAHTFRVQPNSGLFSNKPFVTAVAMTTFFFYMPHCSVFSLPSVYLTTLVNWRYFNTFLFYWILLCLLLS